MDTLMAAAPGCPTQPAGLPPGWYYLLTLLLALCSIGVLLWIANGYSSPARRKAVIGGRLVEVAGMTAALIGAVLISFFAHRDRCGHTVGAGTLGTWLLVAGLAGFAVGTLIRASTEWISFAVVVIADLWLLAVLAWSQVAHRAAIAVILGTHALCTSLTVAWSRRTRAAERSIKAKASEAGRQLAAAWLIIALLYLAWSGVPNGSTLPETTVLNVFVIAAIVLVTGTGYTKYTEAMAALGDRQPPSDRLTQLFRPTARRPSPKSSNRTDSTSVSTPAQENGPDPMAAGDSTPHPGTGLWRTWQIFDPDNIQESAEFSLYSDTWFTNIVLEPGWPVDLMPTMPNLMGSGVKFAGVARVRWSPDASRDSSDVRLATDSRAHHGGDSGDELAALLSLALGMRCRNGGITRRWLIDRGQPGLDPLGMPIEADHRPPVWDASISGRPMLPMMPLEVDLASASPLLTKFATASAEKAALLVRAARLYSGALWIADSDANQAWLQLVSAIETLATRGAGTKPTWRRTEEGLPEVWNQLMAVGGDDHARAIGDLLAQLVRSTDRFLNFLDKHLPPPPNKRPEEFAQLDWTDLRPRFKKIYDYRSRALHDGTPFPDPMCRPAIRWGTETPVETPPWHSSSSGLATWAARDVPMFLHTFEYVVRGALVAWWTAL